MKRAGDKEDKKEETIICWSSEKGPIFWIRVNLLPFSFFPPCLPLFPTLSLPQFSPGLGKRGVRVEMDPWEGREGIYWKGKGELLSTSDDFFAFRSSRSLSFWPTRRI